MRPITIGLVDDNVRLRQDIREKLALNEELAVLWEEQDGAGALKRLEAGQIPHLLLMDISMPDMDGITATRLAKQSYPNLKILMLTVMDDEQKLFEAIKAGAAGYLLKDVKPHHLLNAIDEVMEGSLPLSPSMAKSVLSYLRDEKKEAGTTVPSPPSNLETLSKREKEVLEWLKKGMTVHQIGDKLFISDRTVKKHLEHIYQKLQVHSGKEAIVKGLGRG